MSDVQYPQLVLQRRIQQRQILAMMGINQWVHPSSETLNISDIAASTVMPSTIQSGSTINNINTPPHTEQSVVSVVNPVEERAKISDSSADYPYNEAEIDVLQDGKAHIFSEQSPVIYSFDTTAPEAANQAVTSLVDTVVQQTAVASEQTHFGNDHHENMVKVAPFDLQGGRYGDWVILVDIQALNDDSQKLWQNITQALSIDCETTSFPICEGMDTAELANASFAGYVFKIGRSEEIQVVTLTALPEGLEHPNLTTAPTLDEMLADNSLKRQLWEMLLSSAD